MAVVPIIKIHKDSTPKILETKCENVKIKNGKFDNETKELIQNLLDTARAAKNPAAAGLAAPQIGVNKRVCVVRQFLIDPNDAGNELITDFVLVNPKIISKSNNAKTGWESCLSIPNLYGMVQRAEKVKITAYDINAQKISIKAKGFFARVIQHELDHLDGILFTTKLVGEAVTEDEFDQIVQGPAE